MTFNELKMKMAHNHSSLLYAIILNRQKVHQPPKGVVEKSMKPTSQPIVAQNLQLDPAGPDMSCWVDLNLETPLVCALQDLKFTSPTNIQLKAIPPIMAGKDVLGAAQTGSGKTLAFGLPILNSILTRNSLDYECHALILVPTRELALQLSDHMKKASKYCRIKVPQCFTSRLSLLLED